MSTYVYSDVLLTHFCWSDACSTDNGGVGLLMTKGHTSFQVYVKGGNG
jgi:hypothetical protein